GRFEVELPGEPERKTADGAVTFSLTTDNGATNYFVRSKAYGRNVEAEGQKALEGLRDGILKTVKGQLLDERPVTLDGHPGLDLIAATPEGHLYQRLLLVGDRLYMVHVRTTKDSPLKPADVRKFLESLRPTPADGGDEKPAPYEAAIRAVKAAYAAAIIRLLHPDLRPEVDEPVLRLILTTLRSELGAPGDRDQ